MNNRTLKPEFVGSGLASGLCIAQVQGMRILVAEDIADTRYLMKLLLEGKGHAVLEAANGKEAVERAVSDHPDLILMDLSMPVMDGLAAIRCIRENVETASIPIVALSSHLHDPLWRDRAMSCGCNQCYAKPLDFEGLDGLLAFASAGVSE